MSGIDASSVLSLRNAVIQRSDALRAAVRTEPVQQVNFSRLLASVNAAQSDANLASAAYERGETSDIAGVMLARQKSTVAFEATLQVRNKLLSAYRDIMNMPV
jgi:flagellar hook-basal body complex protein FliE